ncbi:MAG: hypothetical protein NTZ03_15030 [Actinobacteria bacterium]|nr:hypothetical protein [Actinomycetota bacterium]
MAGKRKDRSADDRERLGEVVTTAVAQGLELVTSVRANWRSMPTRSRETRELEKAHQKAIAQQTSQVRAYESRMRRARNRVAPMATTAAVTGTLTIVGVAGVASIPFTATIALATVTGAAALSAYRSRQLVHHPPPEPSILVPAPPPPRLRNGARGDSDARRLLRIRAQLTGLIPAVSTLHPEAGVELARADSEAGPALNALVHRLEVLDQMERSLPGTEAARTAALSAQDIAVRLAVGVETYDRLMAAAAAMLSAPDFGRSSDEVLGPAVDALAAYAHGLTVSYETFSTDI